ncbi:MAG: hypothetical protein SGARI_003964 [Bacillariaceae sp.]
MSNAEKVEIRPEVLVLMASHASSHPTTSVHGVLIGNAAGKTLKVTNAYPICHETPTKTLVETSLAMVQSSLDGNNGGNGSSSKIMGWYTAPELLGDTKPAPVALRVVASLEDGNDGLQPVLIVLNNEAIVNGNGSSTKELVTAFGKDFGIAVRFWK